MVKTSVLQTDDLSFPDVFSLLAIQFIDFYFSICCTDYHIVSLRYRQKSDKKMPKLSETFASRLPSSLAGTDKYWDADIKGLVFFVGKRSKTWYFQKDVGGQTKRILIGRFPIISAQAARQTALGFALEMGRGAVKAAQIGAPTLEAAMEVYLARPKLRSENHWTGTRAQLAHHLKDWMRLPLDEISKSMAVRRHQEMSGSPSAANHVRRIFSAIYNHARRTCYLAECPTMAIEWF